MRLKIKYKRSSLKAWPFILGKFIANLFIEILNKNYMRILFH